MTNEDRLLELKEKFKELYNEHITVEGSESLLGYLENETDFFEAPASTMYHNSHPGGLVEHSINVFEKLVNLVKFESSELIVDEEGKETFVVGELNYEMQTLAIVGLLHDVCKINTYEIDYRNVKEYDPMGQQVDKGGRYDWVRKPFYRYNDKMPYGRGDKSVYIIQTFMPLTLEEAMAIRHHTGGIDNATGTIDPNAAASYKQFPLGMLVYQADLQCAYSEQQ